jgi:hypothetical protein
VIPKSQDFKVILHQECVALFVGDLTPQFIMLSTIDLDYEPGRVAGKVDNQPINRNLAPEMKSARLQQTQRAP